MTDAKCKLCDDLGYIISYNIGRLSGSNWIYVPKNGSYIKPCKCNEECKPIETERFILRRTWDSIWMELAKSVATRSTCKTPDRQVGCVVVSEDNTRVLALGYNGSAKGDDNGCEYAPKESGMGTGEMNVIVAPSRCTCVHAEMNALTKLDTTDPCKKKMYLTLSPCSLCYKLIINAGIGEVIFEEKYRDVKPISKLISLGIKVGQRYEHD